MGAFRCQGSHMLQGRALREIEDQKKRMDLCQTEEQQQPKPEPGSNRLQVQADPEQAEQRNAECLMSPEVAETFPFLCAMAVGAIYVSHPRS